jgi:hypothetical protein
MFEVEVDDFGEGMDLCGLEVVDELRQAFFEFVV